MQVIKNGIKSQMKIKMYNQILKKMLKKFKLEMIIRK